MRVTKLGSDAIHHCLHPADTFDRGVDRRCLLDCNEINAVEFLEESQTAVPSRMIGVQDLA